MRRMQIEEKKRMKFTHSIAQGVVGYEKLIQLTFSLFRYQLHAYNSSLTITYISNSIVSIIISDM